MCIEECECALARVNVCMWKDVLIQADIENSAF